MDDPRDDNSPDGGNVEVSGLQVEQNLGLDSQRLEYCCDIVDTREVTIGSSSIEEAPWTQYITLSEKH